MFKELPSSERAAFGVVHNIDNATRVGIRLGLYNYGRALRKEAQAEMLKKNKKGRIYNVRIRGRKARHRASAPHQTAANMTGKLRKSIDFTVQGTEGLVFGANTEYADFLEKGTGKMSPRPTLKNSMKVNYRNGRNYIEGGIFDKLFQNR